MNRFGLFSLRSSDAAPSPSHQILNPRAWTCLLGLFLAIGSVKAQAEPTDPTSKAEPTDQTRLILVSWDGAGDVLVDRLLDEEQMPNLARMAAQGARAKHMVGTWPTKTAPSHATLYTGCGSGVHGITANSVHGSLDRGRTLHRVTDEYRGFSSLALKAEPLFVTTVLEGLNTTVLAATHYSPHDPIQERLEQGRRSGNGKEVGQYRSFSSFEDRFVPAGVIGEGDLKPAEGWPQTPPHRGKALEFHFQAGDQDLYGFLFDDPADPVDGLDSILIRQGSKDDKASAEDLLKPRPANPADAQGWSRAFHVGDTVKQVSGHLYFRLFHLAPDGSKLILYRREVTDMVGIGADEDVDTFINSGSASYDDPMRTYQFGRLGRPLMIGGDGEAEKRLVEAYRFDTDLLIRGFQFAWETWRPDVLFHYAPVLDHAGHAWMAALDPASAVYDPNVGPQLWDVYVQLAREMDRWLGVMLEAAGSDTVIALVSDHGMAFTSHQVATNRILEDAGLLARDADGRIDLAKTRILAADAGFFLRVNTSRYQDGIVPMEEKDQVVRDAMAALYAARDPENGAQLFSQLFPASSLEHLGLDNYGGDLYIDTMPGYYPTNRFPKAIASKHRAPWGSGTHGHWAERRDMHAMFFLYGPGVNRGIEIPAMSQIDVAPTLSKLLGIRAPADACGRVLYEALNLQELGSEN